MKLITMMLGALLCLTQDAPVGPTDPPVPICACQAGSFTNFLGEIPECVSTFGITMTGTPGFCYDPDTCNFASERPCTGFISFTVQSSDPECVILVDVITASGWSFPFFVGGPFPNADGTAYSLECGDGWTVRWREIDGMTPKPVFAIQDVFCMECAH